MSVHHAPGCPLQRALEAEARTDAAHLLATGIEHYVRPLTSTELAEFRWLRPLLDPDDYRVLVGLLGDLQTRVRAYVRHAEEKADG